MTAPRILGFVPAKGGSTRFPRKNIAALGGRPLLGHAVDAARASGVIDSLAVSSEDDAVLRVARAEAADHVLRRPDHLARDPAGIVDVVLDGLDALARTGAHFDIVVVLPPCAPLREPEDVRAAVALFHEVQPRFVLSVSEFTHTPFAALVRDAEGHVVPAFPEHFGRKSQQMPQAFRPNGAIHVLGVERLRRERSYLAPPLVPYVMPRARSVDIDTVEDLADAEAHLARARNR